MRFLSNININCNNIIAITISENLEGLSTPQTDKLENYWTNSNVCITGSASNSATSMLYGDENSSVAFSPLRLREEKEYFLRLQLNTVDKLVNQYFLDPFINSLIKWFPSEIFSNDLMYSKVLIGSFKTESFIGSWDFSIIHLDNLYIDIVPYKIDFESDYQQLTEDISNDICELTTRFGSINQLYFKEDYTSTSNPYNETIHLKSLIPKLCESVDFITKYPYLKTSEFIENVPLGSQKEFDIHYFVSNFNEYNWVRNGALASKFRGYTPLSVNNKIKKSDIDNFPNRYVKYVLRYCLDISYDILQHIEKYNVISKNDRIRMTEVETWIDNLEERLYAPFFSEISSLNTVHSSSQVLEKRTGYQDVALLYDKLQTSLTVDWNTEIFNEDRFYSRPVYELYEIWCFLEIKKTLEIICGFPINQDIVSTNNDRVKFNLSTGNSGALTYQYNNSLITLYYNKTYSYGNYGLTNTSYTLTYKPDITIEVQKSDGDIELHHFDSKYKITANGKTFKDEDIFKMHAYKDGIKNSLSSNILYPGSLYKLFNSPTKGFIGTIPYRPGNTQDKDRLNLIIYNIVKNINNHNRV